MIPSSWAHNSSILRHRNFLNRNNTAINSNRHSLASYQPEDRDGPVSLIQRQPVRYTASNFRRPRSPPPPFVMRDNYYLESHAGSPSAMDTRAAEEKTMEASASRSKSHNHNGVTYETTANGDVAIVQPSFDDHDGRSPGADKVKLSTDGETRSPPTRDPIPPPHLHHRGHRRDLSEHFQDATTLSTKPTAPTEASSGQKHRRGYSGGLSNPAQAHRRIDSIGNSATIKRGGPRDHRRIDSSGLDALTAAADFSREELAAAAAGGRNMSWDPSGIRRSPIEISYDHGNVGQSHHQARSTHHHHYAPPPTGMYYGPGASHIAPAYPPTYYAHHAGPGFGRFHPPPPSDRYPVQHSRSQDPFVKDQTPLQQPVLEQPREDNMVRRASPTPTSIEHGIPVSEEPAAPTPSSKEGMDPPAPPSWRAGGSTQGVQTYVTTIGVGSTTHTLEANPQLVPTAGGPLDEPSRRHHRKLSSFSTLAPLLFGDTGGEHPLKRGDGHHRSTSSVSFLDVLDVQNTDAAFLRNLQATTGAPPAGLNSKEALKADPAVSAAAASEQADPSTKLAAGGTSKRVRRKCTIEGCLNRVVQGGLCIAHGAKRKQCKHPGCTKHVKKAGLCSTHGPARRRCDAEGCSKVAVQGGRCIAHGAKKRSCSIDQCTKQAILGGMCKKHHDQSQQGSTSAMRRGPKGTVCQVVTTKKGAHSSKLSSGSPASKKSLHHRGLSIFQEMSAESVGTLLSAEAASAAAASSLPPTHAHRSTFSREFANLY